MTDNAPDELQEHVAAVLPALFEFCGWNRSFSLKRLRSYLNEHRELDVTSADNSRLADVLARRDDVFPVTRDGTRWQFGRPTRPTPRKHLILED